MSLPQESPAPRREARGVLNAALLLAAFFAVDKLVALGRQFLIARTFGVNPALDAFNTANNLPDLLFVLIAGGGLSLAFIPVLTETLTQQGRAAAWRLFSQIANLAFLLTGAIACLLALDPLFFVQVIVAPGFDFSQQQLVAELMRLNLIATLLFSLSGLVIGALQANRHFLTPALAPILYNVGQIVGVLVLAPRFGVHGLVYGVILGALLHLGIQIPALLRFQFRWSPGLALRDPAVRHVLRLMAPRVLTIGLLTAISIVNDRLASGLGPGVVSALFYGWQLMQLPETIVGTALGTALLPTLSAQAARGDAPAVRRTLRRALLILFALLVPATLLGVLLVGPAIRLVLEGRAFTPEASALVIPAAQLYLLGLLGHSINETAARTFYAHQDARTPAWLAGVTLAVYALLAVGLSGWIGYPGLALANSLAFTTEAVLFLVILYRRRIL